MQRSSPRPSNPGLAATKTTGSLPLAFEATLLEPFTADARQALGKETWDATVKEGRALPVDEAIAMALKDDPEET